MKRFPLPQGSYWWSSGYRSALRPNHMGVDLAASEGTPLLAVIDGRIVVPAYDAGAGNNVWLIAHDNSVLYKYFHMSAISVRTNQNVSAGDVVGKVGNTGASQGAHLHFERHGGTSGVAWTDPTNYLRDAEVNTDTPPTPPTGDIDMTAEELAKMLDAKFAAQNEYIDKRLEQVAEADRAVMATVRDQGCDRLEDRHGALAAQLDRPRDELVSLLEDIGFFRVVKSQAAGLPADQR